MKTKAKEREDQSRSEGATSALDLVPSGVDADEIQL